MRTREEQIEEMVQVNSAYLCHEDYTTDNLRMMLAAAISEAEERARAECAADTQRIEYFDRYKTKAISRWNDNLGRYEWSVQLDKWYPTFRAAIDAAMETK